jgi:UDP-N-acetylmuramoyl-tripeptide--D-alanyl-D-alanine ligase
MTGYPVALSQAEFIAEVGKNPAWREFAVDSRRVTPGSVFFALPGDRTDGHRYIPAAISAGARAVVLYKSYFESHEQTLLEAAGIGDHTDESPLVPELKSGEEPVVFVPVADSLSCLQAAGAAVLSTSRALRIGVTGSNGKTGTKDMLAAVLRRVGSVHSRSGNFNSVIGLPVVMAATPADADYAVLEMAMSEVGEMDALAEIVRPNAGILTNVGTAHIGNIGSREGIAREKFRMFSLMEADDLAVVPGTDELAMSHMAANPLGCRVVRYGCSGEYGFELIESSLRGSRFRYGGAEFRIPVAGDHHIHNACAVITLARELGVEDAHIVAGLAAFTLPSGRGEVISAGSLTIVNDSYNANPDSMAAAFSTAAHLARDGRLLFVLGDMKELGDHADEGHDETLKRALEGPADAILTYGDDFARAAAKAEHAGGVGADRIVASADYDELSGRLRSLVRPGDTVLLKGSRSMELERLIPLLESLGAGENGEMRSV